MPYASGDASLAVFLVSEDHTDIEQVLGAVLKVSLTQRLGAIPSSRYPEWLLFGVRDSGFGVGVIEGHNPSKWSPWI